MLLMNRSTSWAFAFLSVEAQTHLKLHTEDEAARWILFPGLPHGFPSMIIDSSYQYTVYVWVSISKTSHSNCVLVLKWVQPGSGDQTSWVAKLIMNSLSLYLGNTMVKMLGQIIGFKSPQRCHLSRFSWIYLSRGGEQFSRTRFQSLSLWNWAVWELH